MAIMRFISSMVAYGGLFYKVFKGIVAEGQDIYYLMQKT